MNKFKVGDKVKQIKHLYDWENSIATITNIENGTIFHRHDGSLQIFRANAEDFELVLQDEIIYLD
jgi:hypothetical protein